jgi:hypothetical protein
VRIDRQHRPVLRVLNATFNTALATTRFEAAGAMLKILGGTGFTTKTELFRLAKVEIDDAVRVLTEVPNLGGAARTALQSASAALADLIATPTVDGRRQKIDNIRVWAAAISVTIDAGGARDRSHVP